MQINETWSITAERIRDFFLSQDDILQKEVDDPRLRSARQDVDIVVEHDEKAYDNIRNTVAYKPEESWNYEFGTHLNLFDNRLHLDLCALTSRLAAQAVFRCSDQSSTPTMTLLALMTA